MSNSNRYAIQCSAPGTYSTADTTKREHVRGFALAFGWQYAKYEGARLTIREGTRYNDGKSLACYVVNNGKWVKVFGTEIRGLEGLDGAGCYMAHYPLPHVTREYAEFMAG